MEVTLFWAYLVPAVLALAFKGGLFLYAYKHRPLNSVTRLYVYLLIALTAQNIVLVTGYPELSRGTVPYFEADVFYVVTTWAIVLILHLAVAMAFHQATVMTVVVVRAAYAMALALTLLILNTSWIVSGYEITNYVITRIPGPMYPLWSIYAAGSLLAGVGILVYGALHQATRQKRLKSQLLVLALIPMQLTMMTVLVMLHLGVKWINVSLLSPILITYLLVVTAYATHQHRLFDIQFYIPWSKVRKRKTAFYQRLRAMVAELADAASVNQAINLLADVLRCPVALISGPRPVLAISGNSADMVKFPLKELRGVNSILVANEISDAMPSMHSLMREHGVAAIVPFYPHSHTAASWMLLGDSFSDQVYTPLDFKMVEQVFDRLGDLFLDKLLFMRSQLHEAREQLQTLQLRLDVSEERGQELQKQLRKVVRQNGNSELSRPALGKRGKADRNSKPAPVVALVPKPPVQGGKPLDSLVADFEARMIEQTLERCGGNQSQAARLLGLRPNTLHYKIERYGLADKKNRERPED